MPDEPMKLVVNVRDGTEAYVPLTAAEIVQRDIDWAAAEERDAADLARAWHTLRMQRDRWLAQTDWIVNPLPADTPAQVGDDITANAAGWLTFRQQLRDLPENTADPTQAAWPVQPPDPKVRLT